MKYNFDKMTERDQSFSLKWDVTNDVLPMWVADMDFEIAPEIIEALSVRLDHKIFGYNIVPKAFFKSIQEWWEVHHQIRYNTSWMMFCTGVVPAISSIIRKLTSVGDNVLIQSPVYNIFYNSILNNGRHVVSNDLIYKNGAYSIDFKGLEVALMNPQTTLMIVCNPHNPIGKIWDKETLKRIADLCAKHHVIVLSDEIHCDVVSPGNHYIPFASVSNIAKMNSITCIAPTKAFNLAGLQTSCTIIPNEQLRYKVERGINTDEVAEPNTFAVVASIAAFTKGKPWLQAMCTYVEANKQMAISFIENNLSQLFVVKSEATYLLWIDCSRVCEDDTAFVTYLKEHTGLWVSNGSTYGQNGKQFIRMNIACPKDRLIDGLERLRKGVISYISTS